MNEAKLVVAVDYDSRAIFLSRIEMQVANAYSRFEQVRRTKQERMLPEHQNEKRSVIRCHTLVFSFLEQLLDSVTSALSTSYQTNLQVTAKTKL